MSSGSDGSELGINLGAHFPDSHSLADLTSLMSALLVMTPEDRNCKPFMHEVILSYRNRFSEGKRILRIVKNKFKGVGPIDYNRIIERIHFLYKAQLYEGRNCFPHPITSPVTQCDTTAQLCIPIHPHSH